MSDKGQKVAGDPSLDNMSPDDIISIGNERPTQETTSQPLLDNLGNPQVPVEEATPPVNPVTPETPQVPIETTTPAPDAQTIPAEQAPVEAEAPAQQQIDPWNSVFSSLKNDNGIEFQSKDQFIQELNSYNQYKQDPLGFLEPEIKAHAEFIKAGGNTQDFYRMKSVDFKALPDKEILFQSHLKDHPDHAKDPEFARMYFEKQFDSQFSILAGNKKTQADFLNEVDGIDEPDHIAFQNYQRDYQFAEKSLEFDSNAKRESLVSWQEKSTSPPTQPGTGMTEEEVQAQRAQYQAGVDQVKASYTGEEIPISDKPEENLKIGLNDEVRPQWEKDISDPMSFFSDLGLQTDGKLDMNKLSRASFIFRMWDNLGPIATKLILENQARETVTGRQINATPTNGTTPPGDVHGDDELQEVADLFLQQQINERSH